MPAVLIVLAVLFAAYSVVLFMKKGPIPCVHYFLLTPEEQAEVRVWKEYRNAGVWMLLFAAGCLAGCAVFVWAPGWMTKYLLVLAACLAIYLCAYDLKPRKWEDMPESKVKRGGTGDIM